MVAEYCYQLSGGCPEGGTFEEGDGAAEDSLSGGHGTTVAGIIASRGSSGVPSGMAPQAEIVAYRVGDNDGIFSSDVDRALEHVLVHRPDVDVVNLSLGSTALYGSVAECDTDNGDTLALVSALRDRGTMVVAASGNDAQTGTMSSPACLTGVVSVGAVYDASGSGFAYDNCEDTTRARDQVICYSNSAVFLDLLAPSHCVASTAVGGGATTCFGGTSATAPYVAGAFALLMESGHDANEALTDLVDSGVLITDTRPGPTIGKRPASTSPPHRNHDQRRRLRQRCSDGDRRRAVRWHCPTACRDLHR